MSRRIVHVIAEYSYREAMGRTIAETADRVAGEHSLITSVAHDGGSRFAHVRALGGSVESFPFGRTRPLEEALRELSPDVVHVHGGAISPLAAAATSLRHYRSVLTMYAWPTVPSPRALARVGLSSAVRSNVLRPRVLVATVLPRAAVGAALRRAGVGTVLSPDPRVVSRLDGYAAAPVWKLGSGAPDDPRRARWEAATPTILFAGRAERARGIDPLLDAFALVRHQVPGARLRLLLLARPELSELLERVSRAGLTDAIDVAVGPQPDLLGEMASAQLGVWPFMFDYTTSPPAMAVVEAMSVGLPVVSSSVACVEAAAEHGQGALLTPPGDVAALSRAMLAALSDERRWHDLSVAAATAVRGTHGWDRTADVTEKAYAHAEAVPPRRQP